MTRLATQFVTIDDLIIVEVLVTGPCGALPGRFVLDTGAAATTMTHELADSLGYGPRDGFRRTKVHTAIGVEEGYVLRVAEFTVLGFTLTSFPINVFDLGHDGIDGLVGMNFLSDFNYEIRSSERRILVEKDRPMKG
jgi:clan AA aspartic protease (TIGR02281 family)